jgi:hypothetical protein
VAVAVMVVAHLPMVTDGAPERQTAGGRDPSPSLREI